jgi:hypothetical protein
MEVTVCRSEVGSDAGIVVVIAVIATATSASAAVSSSAAASSAVLLALFLLILLLLVVPTFTSALLLVTMRLRPAEVAVRRIVDRLGVRGDLLDAVAGSGCVLVPVPRIADFGDVGHRTEVSGGLRRRRSRRRILRIRQTVRVRPELVGHVEAGLRSEHVG